jgi:hypothetical protein
VLQGGWYITWYRDTERETGWSTEINDGMKGRGMGSGGSSGLGGALKQTLTVDGWPQRRTGGKGSTSLSFFRFPWQREDEDNTGSACMQAQLRSSRWEVKTRGRRHTLDAGQSAAVSYQHRKKSARIFFFLAFLSSVHCSPVVVVALCPGY